MLRSMRLHLNPDAPSELSIAECKRVLDDPELVELDKALSLLEEQLKESDTVKLRQRHLETTWSRKHCFERSYREARVQSRAKFYEMAELNKSEK
jgi:hypothetical protein